MSPAQELVKTEATMKPLRVQSAESKTSLQTFASGGFITNIARGEWPADLAHWRDDLRHAAQNLRFAMKDQTPCVIGFASAQSGEGVSTLAVAMSLLLAHDQQQARAQGNGARHRAQTLLLDAHARRPALHRLFGASLAHGLAEILREEISPAQAMKEVPASNLKLLTAGETDAHGLRYDQIAKLGALLRELKTQFEFVFMDLPPVLHGVEAAELGKLCDGLVFIVKAHRTKRETVLAALRVLEMAGVRVLGCVFNQRRFFVPNWLSQRL
jgi:Mrp family chromosome partitioning ATPase